MCCLSKYIRQSCRGHRSSGTTAYGGTGRRDFGVDDILWGSVGVVSTPTLVRIIKRSAIEFSKFTGMILL